MVKRIIKEVAKKIAKKVTVEETPEVCKYNQYGVCIACQGGRMECLHNNLTTVGNSVVCVLCGFKVK